MITTVYERNLTLVSKIRCAAVCMTVVVIFSSLFSFAGCRSKDDYLIKIGDYEITYKFYRYLYMNYRKEFDAEGYSEDELDAEARKNTLISLMTTCRVQTLADRYGITVPDSIIESVGASISEMKNEYDNEDDYKVALTGAYTDEELLREVMISSYLDDFVRQYVTAEKNGCIRSDDATVEEYIYSDFYRAVQILIKKDGNDDDDRHIAEEIYSRICSGESFESLSAEYNQDMSVDDPSDGYYFALGQMISEFEDAVVSIEENEIYPGVVESDIGYHIIKRLPLEPSYVNDNFNKLREVYKAKKYSDICCQTEDELDVEYTELYEVLTAQDYINGVMEH